MQCCQADAQRLKKYVKLRSLSRGLSMGREQLEELITAMSWKALAT